jgi:hypothetical protein
VETFGKMCFIESKHKCHRSIEIYCITAYDQIILYEVIFGIIPYYIVFMVIGSI